jgi:di/tricarboxylate transporter
MRITITIALAAFAIVALVLDFLSNVMTIKQDSGDGWDITSSIAWAVLIAWIVYSEIADD